ncbi:MAG: hypothetical protein KatS3mg045_1377 [Bellilinea sp.]|nr:MAG: hypothetical protein KatS3mg045_1377 [Bellilinea sp.]
MTAACPGKAQAARCCAVRGGRMRRVWTCQQTGSRVEWMMAGGAARHAGVEVRR